MWYHNLTGFLDSPTWAYCWVSKHGFARHIAPTWISKIGRILSIRNLLLKVKLTRPYLQLECSFNNNQNSGNLGTFSKGFLYWRSFTSVAMNIYPVTIRWHTGHRTTKMARATVGIFSEWCMPSVCATFFPMVFFRMMPSMCAINRGTGYRFTLDLVDWCRNTKYKYVCSF